jgi:hypothetical protein
MILIDADERLDVGTDCGGYLPRTKSNYSPIECDEHPAAWPPRVVPGGILRDLLRAFHLSEERFN